MKTLRFIPIVLAVFPISVLAKSNTIYADVQVTDLVPTHDFVWERKNKKTPKYPIEFASAGIRGCAVLSFEISEAGRPENIEVTHSAPNRHLGQYSRKMLKKWQWVPASPTAKSVAEKRTLRLDFCMGGESTEQAEKACKQQAQLVCG